MDDHTDPEAEGREEFEGEDLEQVLSHASASLGIPRENLDYEVLQEGRRGFLGVGTRGVRIRVALPQMGNVAETGGSGGEAAEGAGESDLGRINRFLERFVQSSPFEVAFSVIESPERISIELQGKDCELFLARRGEGLNALQVLLGRIASHVGSERAVFLDCGDFRKGREEELSEIALLTAEKVKKLGEPQTLSPMNPYDRRLVHLALKDDPALETRSEGEGFLKSITIFPRSR